MAWYHKFPWTNFHELNLDWILDIVKRAENALPDVENATERANSAADLANNNAVAASDAATRANIATRKIEPVTATATTVYGAGASVTVRNTYPGMAFDFKIPAGEKGDPGPAGGAGDLISNGNFTNPVNQRGAASYNGNGSKMYTIDRWFTTSSVAGAVVVGNRFVKVAEGATISQIIPASSDGSFPSDTDVGYTAVARETNGTMHVASSELTDSKLSFEIGEANSGITVTLGSGSWEYCALYRGRYTANDAPGYVAKEYVTQLADCHRYYYQLNAKGGMIFPGCVFSDTNVRIGMPIPQPMRISPTVTIDNISNITVFSASGANTGGLTEMTTVEWDAATAYIGLFFSHNIFSTGPITVRYNTILHFSADL